LIALKTIAWRERSERVGWLARSVFPSKYLI
jgi:hypothetical protein